MLIANFNPLVFCPLKKETRKVAREAAPEVKCEVSATPDADWQAMNQLRKLAGGRTTVAPPPVRDLALSQVQAPRASQDRRTRLDSEAIHMTQGRDGRYNPTGSAHNSDCAPTSLTMGLEALGLTGRGNVQQRIDESRYQMNHGVHNGRDGVDEFGERSQAEHRIGNSLADVERGARRQGAQTSRVQTLEDLRQALDKGHPVVLLGNDSGRLWGRHNQGFRTLYNGLHAVLISGYDRRTNEFTVNDPLSHSGPVQVSARDLSQFHSRGRSNLTGVELSPAR